MNKQGKAVTGAGRQRFIIFLPVDLAEQIRALAQAGRRPLNTQFEILLEDVLRQETYAVRPAAEAAA